MGQKATGSRDREGRDHRREYQPVGEYERAIPTTDYAETHAKGLERLKTLDIIITVLGILLSWKLAEKRSVKVSSP